MKIFLDFDDCLFDTGLFLKSLEEIFATSGVTPELFHRTYQAMKENASGNGWQYSCDAHIEMLKPEVSFDEQSLREKLKVCFAHTAEFLFPDVKNFLATLKSGGIHLFVLSFGDPTFQKQKIAGTGIGVYLEKSIITSIGKAEALQAEIATDDDDIWFFDDRIHFIEEVKKAFPKVHTVLVCRAQGRYNEEKNECCDCTVKDLIDGQKILSEYS